MAVAAAVQLDRVEPLFLSPERDRHAVAVGARAREQALVRDAEHREPIDGGIVLGRRRGRGGGHRGQVHDLAPRRLDLRRVDQPVAAHPDAVARLRQVGDHITAQVVGHYHLRETGAEIVCLGDDPDARFRPGLAGDDPADVVAVDLHGAAGLSRRPSRGPGGHQEKEPDQHCAGEEQSRPVHGGLPRDPSDAERPRRAHDPPERRHCQALTPPERRATIQRAMSFLESRTRAARQGFGKPILRKEDARLLVGGGCYSDDVNVPGQAYACFVRSPHAHARVERIETGGALATPGVIAVLTGADALADGVKPLTHSPMPGNPVRFVGEIVAMVVAETQAAARDGAERVDVRWTALPAVPLSTIAARPDAPLLYDGTRSNVCVDTDLGDAAAVDRAFAGAAHVVRLDTWVHRVTGVPMEPRAAVGVWDQATGRYTVHAGAGRRATSAATSARATAAIRSSRWSRGPRGVWDGR